VRVRGLFSNAGLMQFISSELVEAAAHDDRIPRRVIDYGVDVARFGDDVSISDVGKAATPSIFRRSSSVAPIPMELAAPVAEESTPEPGRCDPHRWRRC
jgi:hypothetical protein